LNFPQLENHLVLVAAVRLVGLVALIVAVGWLLSLRTRRIAAARAGETFADFLSRFTDDDIPREVLVAVYYTFQDWWSDEFEPFPVRANDDIADIFGMVDEDLDDTIQHLVAECDRTLPDLEHLQQTPPVVTVEDLARFVAACPRTV